MAAGIRPTFIATSIDSLDVARLFSELAEQGTAPKLATLDLDDTIAGHNEPAIRPAAMQALQALADGGVEHLYIISNAEASRVARVQSIVEAINKQTDLRVNYLVSAEDGRPKPSRQMYRKALARTGVSAAQAIHIGDQLFKDIWGANRAHYAASVWLSQPIGASDNRFVQRIQRPVEQQLLRRFRRVTLLDKQ